MGKLLSEIMLDLKKCPNHKMHESESAWAVRKVQHHFQNQFSHKVIYKYCLIFFLKHFGQYLTKKKMDFLLYFQKRICPMSGVIFTSES